MGGLVEVQMDHGHLLQLQQRVVLAPLLNITLFRFLVQEF